MARNRKGKGGDKSAPSGEDDFDIPESEQWRIINESGILKQIIPKGPQASQVAEQDTTEEGEGLSPFAEEVFNALMLITPMSFMLLLMEILVHYQYGRKPEFRDIMDRMLPGVPIISIFVFYTNRYKSDKRMQAALFWVACIAGPRLVWLMNRGNWLTVMRQSPPMATAWIYCVLQLDLFPATLNLLITGVFTWYKGLKIVP